MEAQFLDILLPARFTVTSMLNMFTASTGTAPIQSVCQHLVWQATGKDQGTCMFEAKLFFHLPHQEKIRGTQEERTRQHGEALHNKKNGYQMICDCLQIFRHMFTTNTYSKQLTSWTVSARKVSGKSVLYACHKSQALSFGWFDWYPTGTTRTQIANQDSLNQQRPSGGKTNPYFIGSHLYGPHAAFLSSFIYFGIARFFNVASLGPQRLHGAALGDIRQPQDAAKNSMIL